MVFNRLMYFKVIFKVRLPNNPLLRSDHCTHGTHGTHCTTTPHFEVWSLYIWWTLHNKPLFEVWSLYTWYTWYTLYNNTPLWSVIIVHLVNIVQQPPSLKCGHCTHSSHCTTSSPMKCDHCAHGELPWWLIIRLAVTSVNVTNSSENTNANNRECGRRLMLCSFIADCR